MRNSVVVLSVLATMSVACATDTNAEPIDLAGKAGSSANGGGGSPTAGAATGGVPAAMTPGSSGSGGVKVAGAGGSGGAGGSSVAGSGGAGGSGGSGGSVVVTPTPSVCDGAATRVLALADVKVDDFEDAMISPSWSSFNDVMPVPNAFSIAQATNDGAATTGKSGHYQGSGAKTLPEGGYGVGTVFNVAINKAQGKYCIDVSAFDGISFWAKAATDAASVELNFVIPETNALKDGGDCASGCYNHPRMAVTLTTAWQQYTVPFASAGQGAHALTNRVQGLVWTAPLDADWDFSIDEIAFYKGAAPTGPVSAK